MRPRPSQTNSPRARCRGKRISGRPFRSLSPPNVTSLHGRPSHIPAIRHPCFCGTNLAARGFFKLRKRHASVGEKSPSPRPGKVKPMIKQAKLFLVAALVSLTGLSFAVSTPAHAGTCKWGGDESDSIRCFDCMRRVWTGERWALVNTCRPHYFNDFAAPHYRVW